MRDRIEAAHLCGPADPPSTGGIAQDAAPHTVTDRESGHKQPLFAVCGSVRLNTRRKPGRIAVGAIGTAVAAD